MSGFHGVNIQGYCPMGCGQTLHARESGEVVCQKSDCPDRLMLTKLIADPETEHVVEFDDKGFTILHPLRERVSSPDLFDCRVQEELRALGEPPVEPGRYRVTWHQPDAYSESYRPGEGPFDYEKL